MSSLDRLKTADLRPFRFGQVRSIIFVICCARIICYLCYSFVTIVISASKVQHPVVDLFCMKQVSVGVIGRPGLEPQGPLDINCRVCKRVCLYDKRQFQVKASRAPLRRSSQPLPGLVRHHWQCPHKLPRFPFKDCLRISCMFHMLHTPPQS